MDALFVVPALCSNTVNPNLIPALSKLIERNILLNNSALFRDAAMIRFNKNRSILRPFRSALGGTARAVRSVMPFSKVHKESLYLDDLDIPITFLNEVHIDGAAIKRMQQMLIESTILAEGPGNKDELYFFTQKRKELEQQLNRMTEENDEAIRNGQKKPHSNHTIDVFTDQIYSLSTDYAKEKMKNPDNSLKDSESIAKIAKTYNDMDNDKLNRKKTKAEIEKLKQDARLKADAIRSTRGARSAEDRYQTKHTFTNPEYLEVPTNVTFFKQISLEPTILEIPISYNRSADPGDSNKSDEVMIVRVGVKAIPYTIDDVTNIKKLLKEARVLNKVEILFKQALRKVDLYKWFKQGPAGKINKGEDHDPGHAVDMIKYTPNTSELNNSKKLASLMGANQTGTWSTMLILSSTDFDEDGEMADVIKNYKKSTQYVFGDIVITNEIKETVFMCSARVGSCYEIGLEYLKKVLNLSSIISSDVVSRVSKPWSFVRANKTTMQNAMSESDTNKTYSAIELYNLTKNK